MYSKNDYRYYLEHQLIYSNGYLAHYGIPGMKWHKRRAIKTINDTAQFISDKGFVGVEKGKKLYNEAVQKRAQNLRMDKVNAIGRDSVRRTKLLRRKAPQIRAASRLLVAETANAASTGITRAIRAKKRKF